MRGSYSRQALLYALPFLIWGGLTASSLFYVFRYVELKPKVDENFFFSSTDPQIHDDKLISRIFYQEPELILSARGDIHSADYLRKLRELTDALSAIPGIDSVQSLTHGPKDTGDALKSPLWRRVLFSEDLKTSFVYVFMKQSAPVEEDVLKVEGITERLNTPDFPLSISGAPYIIELIQRNLMSDLKVFSVASLCVFGLCGLLISRSAAMVLGTLIACTNASALTLILARAFGITIGPLTANLSTIVFVLTLTHMVFMTFNWKYIIRRREESTEKAWARAVRVTILPSSWSMLTALLGFLSLLSVPATPLRQLGIAGAMGTVIAFASAYLIYPFFLRMQRPKPSRGAQKVDDPAHAFFKRRHGRITVAILIAAAAASIGLTKLNTEPSLFTYFRKDSDIRKSLEFIDQNGGSSPLNIVLSNADGSPLRMKEDYPRLWRLQNVLERDPAVGGVMSVTLLLAEAERSPLASLIPLGWILKALESPFFGKSAIYYITKDRTRTLFVVRMKEAYAQSDHLSNVERLKEIIREQGFKPVLIGGTYLLYGKLSKLVRSSMFEGLTLLILVFMIMGGIISRSVRVVGALLISLVVIPLLLLGILGHGGVPMDIISAPGANISIGIGVDAMIHVLIWVRRHPKGMRSWQAWSDVCSRLWRPVLYSMSVVCAGFGIFMLSGFPPTQRFGLSVVLGTLLTPLPALFLLPWFATAGIGKRSLRRRGGDAL